KGKIRLSAFYRHISFLVKLLFSRDISSPVTDEESTLYVNDPTDAEGFELSPEARAQADLKFTYVDNYFEEALKMRNILEEFDRDHGIRPPTILGVREHVFTGSVSSLASFMSSQETSFVTLGQRVLAKPLKIRMHYGHSDVFDRVFHITRGGISKASRVINASEDIFAGFNSILRQGNITHHEYIQVGKGRDVGLNQIALFEGKVAGGNGEQVLSRDVYRLGQLLDFFRMMSFYFTTVGFYFCTMLTVLTLYIFLYGKAYLAFSRVGATIRERAILVNNTALSAALSAQFLFQIGVFTAVPMILGFILEQGFLQAIVSFTAMQFQLCTVFFTFSIGTRAHYFGRTLLHGGASVCQQYKTTGRGFVVKHIKFSENYRLYSRSHFVKGMEVILLLVVYLACGNDEAGSVSYILLTVSSCFLAFSWLFAPYLFNLSGFERQKVVEDFKEWTKWLFHRGGGIGVEGAESWEAWWEDELSHIGTLSGRLVETILSLRFFIFQYGVVYKLNVHGSDTSFAVYGWSWAAFAVILVIFKVFAFIQKISVSFRLVRRFIQGLALLVSLAGIIVAVVLTELSVTDIFACVLAFLPTGWGVLSIACAWKPTIKRIGMWESVRSLARLYDAGMGMLIFLPVALFSLFPFVSTFRHV
ncbi:BnaUnng02530D, partial [Brassica napus]